MKKFNMGRLVATPGALATIEASGDSMLTYLSRHESGIWGEVDEHDGKKTSTALYMAFG